MTSPKKIALVGCPRSGTSLFADYLLQCGLRTVDDSRTSKEYPRGYHEYFPLLVFHKALERYPRGSDHRITNKSFLDQNVVKDPILSQLYLEAFKPFSDPQVDFIKYPQLALSLPFLFDMFPDLHVIAIWRRPSSVFKSLIQKEFPLDMLPGSAARSILLQSVYADHILRANEKYPEKITVLFIDRIINQNIRLDTLLRKLGYEEVHDLLLSQTIQPGIWTQRVNLMWSIFFHITRILLRLGSFMLSPEKRKFAAINHFHNRLLDICYESNHSNH